MTMKPFSTSNPLASIILLSTLLLTTFSTTTAQKFDPYQLNGGLVAAVAGRDYVLIASDTRLTDGGYGVHSRRYLSGRLWSASSSSSVVEVADPLLSSSGGDDIMTQSINNDLIQPPSTITTSNVHWDSNGSLQLPNVISTNSASSSSSSLQTIEPTNAPPTTTTTNPPIMIGSAGCASDCESLKRRVRLELDALTMNNNNNNNSNSKLGVASVANLLQQILYSRRGFPFYSFCVVAGLHPPQELVLRDGDGDDGGKKRMEGAVYVYDAIGSYERVAVGSAGTGRELLQPILDQLFSDSTTTITSKDDDDPSITINNNDNHSNNGKSGDIMAIPPMKQRVGVAGSLRPPVQTVVGCSVEDAVKNVARAYQSVAEREISVGDEVVICVVKSSDVVASSAGDGGRRSEGAVLKVYRYPLKKH
mmetsp:Transcript_21171/g.42501  ORF Transcript_21171/g.42501 Transcript_21171/m.42501 type:complete len:420 (-) Transcript_21171:119-1378(-)